jgi:hypothetical protein
MMFAKRDASGEWIVRAVADGGAAAESQAEIYKRNGYVRVTESERPPDTNYVIWTDAYADDGDGGCVQHWHPSCVVVRLSREKLIAAVSRRGLLDAAVSAFMADASAQDWWINSMNYVEGSPMSEAIKTALSLSDDDIHALVEASRA